MTRDDCVTLDARDASTALGSSDLVVGLHACGELGDHAVRAASEAGASIAIVACFIAGAIWYWSTRTTFWLLVRIPSLRPR